MDTPQPSPVEGEGEYEESTEEGTSQIVVRDARGDIADVTTTLQQNFGAGIAGQGFFLNNSLDNFSRHAEAGEPNHRGPGLHPRDARASATHNHARLFPLVDLGDGETGNLADQNAVRAALHEDIPALRDVACVIARRGVVVTPG